MAELLVIKNAMNLVSAIRQFPIKAAKMTFLEDADAIDRGLPENVEANVPDVLNVNLNIKPG
jgi:hypothetical protein